MNVFNVVRTVLDDLFTKIEPAADRVTILKGEMQNLKKQYWGLANRTESVDYSKPETRFSYIFNYVTAHSNFIYEALQILDQKTNVIQETAEIEITSLGGGPGTDLLGAMKYISRHAKGRRLSINIVDRELAWRTHWRHIKKRIDVDDLPNLDVQYDEIDVMDKDTWDLLDEICESDIFISSFFYSEVVWIGQRANDFFSEVLSRMRTGAYFILVDNKNDDFKGIIDMLDDGDFEEIHNGDGYLSIKEIDETEIDTALKSYISIFDFNAKMSQRSAYFRIYRKMT